MHRVLEARNEIYGHIHNLSRCHWHERASVLEFVTHDIAQDTIQSTGESIVKLAGTRPEWQIAGCAAVLALNTTMRGCELKDLRWKDVDFFEKTLSIQRQSTKTNAGSRLMPLNRVAL